MIEDDKFLRYLSDLDSIINIESDIKSTTHRKILDQNDSSSWEMAENHYEEIRNDLTDIAAISTNISESERVVNRVKDHVFFREHIFIDDDISEKRRFDPDPEIVNAWDRLKQGDFAQCDIDLFKHEQVESILERRKDLDFFAAHRATVELGYVWNPEEAYDGDSG